MARRSLTTLLIMAYFASQLAMVPHAHGADCENEPADHNARPHFHISSAAHVGHSHQHGHDHQHSHDVAECHHHDHDGIHLLAGVSDTRDKQPDHDSDAVYFSDEFGVSLISKTIVSHNFFDALPTLVVATNVAKTVNQTDSAAYNSLAECNPGCPLYLALRALRI